MKYYRGVKLDSFRFGGLTSTKQMTSWLCSIGFARMTLVFPGEEIIRGLSFPGLKRGGGLRDGYDCTGM